MSISRDMMYALGAVALAVIGGGVFRFSRNSTSRLHVLLRVIARVMVLFGFFLIGTVFCSYVSRPPRSFLRAPPFYLTAGLLLGSAYWWLSGLGFRVRSRSGFVGFVGYPVLLIALVGGMQLLVHHLQQSEARSLGASIFGATGRTAPEIQFMDANSQSHALSEFRGKVVLLNFWNTKCGPCIHEMPALSEFQRRFKDRGFVLVYLSSEDARVIAGFFSTRSLEGVKGRLVPEHPVPPFYHSGEAWPISFLVNRQGVVKHSWLGEWPTDVARGWIEKEL